ncbi:MAG: HupE/UreJ family protein [Pseudomonadota bacterium]
MRALIALLLLLLAPVASAHPEDEFCIPGEDGLDPALCEALNAMQSGASTGPLVDAAGEERGALSTLWLYIGVGANHILPGGLDHILFVLALFLTSLATRALVLQITMFTLAHSLTLGLAALGLIGVNAGWVEALIAASIAVVAIENLFVRGLPRWRAPLVFGFGLLHGLGFAGFFGQLELPEHQFLAGLVGFNVGVEIGQLAVLLLALALALPLRRLAGGESGYRRRVVIPGSAAIAAVAVLWTIERLLAL